MNLTFVRQWYANADRIRVIEVLDTDTNEYIYTIMARQSRLQPWVTVTRTATKEMLLRDKIWQEAQGN